jgi:hypothetical protein
MVDMVELEAKLVDNLEEMFEKAFWAQGNDQWSLELEDLLCLDGWSLELEDLLCLDRLSLELENLLCFACWTLLIFSLAFKKQLWVDAIIWIFLHDFGLDVLVHYCNVVEVWWAIILQVI